MRILRFKCLCNVCKGSRKIYDPSSERDPIEGNKMRSVISCPYCNMGEIEIQLTLEEIFKEIIKSFEPEDDKIREIVSLEIDKRFNNLLDRR